MDTVRRSVRRTFHDELLDALGRDICTGRFQPEEILPAEPVLCDRFRVSRIVVREAIKSLAAKGLVEVRRKTGTIVLPRDQWRLFDPDVIGWLADGTVVDDRFVADLMELRRVIEPAAARLAASKATAGDRQAIRTALAAMVDAAGVADRYVPADLAFHSAILAACHNQFLWQMHSALSVLLRTSFVIAAQVPEGPRRSLSLHEDLCAGIENGDAAAAEQAVWRLIERAECDLAAVVRR